MSALFTKENMARLSRDERAELMFLQMSQSGTSYGGGGYLPDDCSDCGACGTAILGTGWCTACFERFDQLRAKALAEKEQADG